MREAGSIVFGMASTSCCTATRCSILPLRRSSRWTLEKGYGSSLLPRHWLNANERGYVCAIFFLESDGGPEGGGGPFIVQARGVNLAEHRSLLPGRKFSLALTGAVGGGYAVRGPEFLLAGTRVDRQLVGGVAAGDAAAGAGDTSAGVAD